jgi:hypothetical protein
MGTGALANVGKTGYSKAICRGSWHLGPMKGPKISRFQTETCVIDNSTQPAVLFLSTKKGVYFPYTSVTYNTIAQAG